MVCMAEQENRRKESQEELIRVAVDIAGIVQGVGFRPFIYKLAKEYKLKGIVFNNETGVKIEAEGSRGNINAFINGLKSPPPIALIESVRVKQLPVAGYSEFRIEKSQKAGATLTFISPDVAVCRDCIRELRDPLDRRFEYPFINCTNCGPRFTIIKDIPYDRPRTTMSRFEMCPECRMEYENPLDRRFHAQPIACPRCGPQVSLLNNTAEKVKTSDPVLTAAELLNSGAIIAIKGLGGFHLACDAYNDTAVKKLRKRKYREDKPFALMCRDIPVAAKLCRFDDEIVSLLESPQSPIVILPARENELISAAVAPGHRFLGIMLPYTPLHHLIFAHGPETLVMTSGNVSDEPIVYKNEDVPDRLGNIADYFLVHNRDIHVRCDDSVVKPFQNKITFFRRARGYVPFPIRLKRKSVEVLACGGELKNTFCLTKGHYAFVSHHIGDLENWETFKAFEEGIEHFKKLFEIYPRVVAYDLHPDYFSTRYALALRKPKIGIQHHYAHALSCMAENDLTGPLLAVIMDGTGYGTDGSIWGCEFFKVDTIRFERLGHLRCIPLMGGDSTIKEPWKITAIYLERTYGPGWIKLKIPFCKQVDYEKFELIKKAMELGLNSPMCSSAGRLFDAVAGLLGVRYAINYEGQAAIELEQLARFDGKTYPYKIETEDKKFVINPGPVIEAIIEDIRTGTENSIISGRFHSTMAEIILDMSVRMRELTGYNEIILSGGVFQNHFLLELAVQKLEEKQFKVYINHKVPANDGGISLGQAYYAALNFEE